MRHLKTIFAVIGAATVLVLAANTVAIAATGQNFLLGKTNTANTVSILKRTTSGPALSINNASTADAPLAVNGTGKVINLNVDKVDGLEGGTRAYKWSYAGAVAGSKSFTLTGLPAGTYLISYSVYMGTLTSDNGLYSSCYLASTAGGGTYGGQTIAPETSTYYPGLSGSALLTQVGGGTTVLSCSTPGNAGWSAPGPQPVQIVAIPISGVTNKGTPTISGKVNARTK